VILERHDAKSEEPNRKQKMVELAEKLIDLNVDFKNGLFKQPAKAPMKFTSKVITRADIFQQEMDQKAEW
jgi:hypothetical protein